MDEDKVGKFLMCFSVAAVAIGVIMLLCIPIGACVRASHNAEIWRSEGHNITTFEALCGVRPHGDDERHTVGVEQR